MRTRNQNLKTYDSSVVCQTIETREELNDTRQTLPIFPKRKSIPYNK